jgi:hypoxanthine phosphoribosyltransferase
MSLAVTNEPSLRNPVGQCLYDAESISQRVNELGAAITADYADEPPLLVGVLKGAFVFMADLCRAIDLPVDIDFMAVSSYGKETQSSGVVRILMDLGSSVQGRRVIIVEDIVDSGLTLDYLSRYMHERQAADVTVCTLLLKEGWSRTGVEIPYVGFSVPDVFMLGYGLDLDQRHRNLPGIHQHDPAALN